MVVAPSVVFKFLDAHNSVSGNLSSGYGSATRFGRRGFRTLSELTIGECNEGSQDICSLMGVCVRDRVNTGGEHGTGRCRRRQLQKADRPRLPNAKITTAKTYAAGKFVGAPDPFTGADRSHRAARNVSQLIDLVDLHSPFTLAVIRDRVTALRQSCIVCHVRRSLRHRSVTISTSRDERDFLER